MPVECRIDGETLLVTMWENFTTQELGGALERAFRELTSPQKLAILIDARRTSENPSGNVLYERADLFVPYLDRVSKRCAVVVADPLRYGLGRMFSAYLDRYGIAVSVFKGEEGSLEEARRWLNGRQC